MSLVFQDYNLIENLTAAENVALGAELSGQGRRQADAVARDRLTALGLGKLVDDYPKTLSGGEQQRVAIARALAGHSVLLLADEPTGALDSESGENVTDAIIDFAHRAGRAALVVTHNPDVATRMDVVIGIRDGQLHPAEPR